MTASKVTISHAKFSSWISSSDCLYRSTDYWLQNSFIVAKEILKHALIEHLKLFWSLKLYILSQALKVTPNSSDSINTLLLLDVENKSSVVDFFYVYFLTLGFCLSEILSHISRWVLDSSLVFGTHTNFYKQI